MSSAMHGGTTSWSVLTVVALVVVASIYLRGWYGLRNVGQGGANVWLALAFLSGELLVAAAVASPLAGLDHHWLTAHMAQHLVLMTLAAPLILLGEPALMFLNSLPENFDTTALDLLQRSVPIHEGGRVLANPFFCWFAGTVCVIVWHVPSAFDLSLQSEVWHGFEQASFFVAGLLFWWPVVQPWPSIARWHRWCVPLYLFLATIPCDALSAFLTFCGRVVYPTYASSPHLLTASALRDQELAGAMMWVWVTFAYLIPALVITLQILSPVSTPGKKMRAECPTCLRSPQRWRGGGTLKHGNRTCASGYESARDRNRPLVVSRRWQAPLSIRIFGATRTIRKHPAAVYFKKRISEVEYCPVRVPKTLVTCTRIQWYAEAHCKQMSLGWSGPFHEFVIGRSALQARLSAFGHLLIPHR
jgi:putative membrane protein